MTTAEEHTADQGSEDLAEGTLLSHLVELRDRLLRVILTVVIVFACMFPWAQDIFQAVAKPLLDVLPGEKMIATQIVSPLLTPFKMTFYAALVTAMPVVLYQIWAFVAPGLYLKEKRFAVPLLASSILLFYAGIAFAYFVVFPLIFGFLTAIAPEGVEVQPDIALFLDFITTIILVFGIAFEVPIATVLIVWTGLTTPDKLGKARPYVFLTAFVIGMFLTPPDFISQTLLAVPIYLLYEIGIVMSKIFARKRAEIDEENDESE